MTATRTWRALLLSLLFLAVAGCGDDGVVFSTWESIDVDEVRDRVQNPTGAITDAQTDEFLAEVERLLPYIRDASKLVLRLVEVIDEAVDNDTEQKATGTQAFLGVACPGQGDQANFDFTHGQIKVETPNLQSEDDIGTILEDNDILIQFEDCEMPSVTVTGPVPARFVSSEAAMILWFEDLGLTSLHGDADDVEGEPDLFDEDGEPLPNGGLPVSGLVVQLDDDRSDIVTIAVSFGPADDSYTFSMVLGEAGIAVTISGVDGSFGCAYDADADPALDCATEEASSN